MNSSESSVSSSAVPQSLPPDRRAGVCLHITSLPGQYGIGEIGPNARAFIDKMNSMELAVWQFLPTGPTAYGDSPYQPLSTFAGNEMLISIGDLLGMGLLAEQEVDKLTTLPEDFVDYGALIPSKNRLLDIAAQRFVDRASDELTAQFAHYLAVNDANWLNDYALFRILKARHGERPWPEWQPEYVRRDQQALDELETSAASQLRGIKIIQFLFYHQWQQLRRYAHSKGVTLFGDMPICIALDSSDAWANRDLLRIDDDGRPDSVAGVPPDYFSEDGQLWGNPLYDWPHHAENNYSWWVSRLRATTELADLVRIDHFRGFESYWSVPANSATARIGAWEPGPGDAIFYAMRKELGSLPIIAENLGVITPEVESLRDRHGIPGMHVLQFDVTEDDFSLSQIDENSVCYTGTHDNDTTLGWFRGSPKDTRSRDEILRHQAAALALTGGPPETVHTDFIRAAFSTPAELAIAPMQDFLGLGSESRINTPGVAGGNWRWRLQQEQITPEITAKVAEMVAAADRQPGRG